jgi:uncharacterized protein (DUF1684 family)
MAGERGRTPREVIELLDWKRRISAAYREAADPADPAAAWRRWCEARDDLYTNHPQSPLPAEARTGFAGVRYYDYDPAFRVVPDIRPAAPEPLEIDTSTGGSYGFTRFGLAHFQLPGGPCTLELYWLENYGGGVFVPFRDATSGQETYGAGRYLLDTVKGADLGDENGRPVFDFNFAYNPSCAYDPKWTCPLAPPPNRLSAAVQAGERIP